MPDIIEQLEADRADALRRQTAKRQRGMRDQRWRTTTLHKTANCLDDLVGDGWTRDDLIASVDRVIAEVAVEEAVPEQEHDKREERIIDGARSRTLRIRVAVTGFDQQP